LLRPFAEKLRLSKTYWIICPQATAKLPKIVTFREWLLAEAAILTGPLRFSGHRGQGTADDGLLVAMSPR